jgi:hypothetical protein
LTVTLLTRPVEMARLAEFYARTRPLGAWRVVREQAGFAREPFPWPALAAWLGSVAATFGSLVAVRDLLCGPRPRGAALLAACAVVALLVLRHALGSGAGGEPAGKVCAPEPEAGA